MIDEPEMIELRILELLESEAKWWTIEELSNNLNFSKATIQKYLGKLKTRIELLPETEVMLETSTSKGIFLHRLASYNVQFLYTDILKELIFFSIFNEFLYNEYVSIVKISSENFISVASVRRKYKAYNFYFQKLNLSIKKDTFTGDERQIRWFFSECYWQIFKGTEWPFRIIPETFIDNIMETIQKFFDLELIPEVKEEVKYWATIQSIRHLKGYRVPEDNEIKKYALNNPLFFSFIEIMTEIFPNEAKNKDPQGPGEMQYLFLLLSSLPVMEKNKNYSQLIYQAHKKGNTLMYRMTQAWLSLYEKIFGKIESKETFFQVENKLLRIHSFSYLYRMGEEFFFHKSYVKELITYHPKFFEQIETILKTLDKEYGMITENRTYLMENYALLATESLDINQFERTVRISLSFSKGILYEQVVQENISSHFNGKYKLEFVNYLEAKEILVTDLPHIVNQSECDLICAQIKLTERDYENIEHAILRYI